MYTMCMYIYMYIYIMNFIFFTPKILFHAPPTLMSYMCTYVYMHVCVCACAFVSILVSLVKLLRALQRV